MENLSKHSNSLWRRFPALTALAGLLAALALLAGCAPVGPNYTPPKNNAPKAWAVKPSGGLAAARVDSVALAAWWDNFKDPMLSRLVRKALDGNLDLAAARARLLQARAALQVAGAGLLPQVDGSASARRSKSSGQIGSGNTTDYYAMGLDASWELDLFGGKRRAVEAARASFAASQADLDAALVSLVAETGLAYLSVRTYQARLAVARENYLNQRETYEIASSRLAAGMTDQLALEQARYNLESTAAAIPSLESGLVAARNSLALALGLVANRLPAELGEMGPIPVAGPALAVGLPADLLRRRPDVIAAERRLAVASAKVGVAEADLYPSLTLTGSIGLEALTPAGLWRAPASTFGLAAGLTAPLFHGGALRGALKAANAQQAETLASYQKAVLTALSEVEGAMAAYIQEQLRVKALTRAADAAAKASELATRQFGAGLTGFTTVLDSQRSLLGIQDSLASSRGEVSANLIRLYKALGGGWRPPAGLAPKTKKEAR